MIFVLVLKHFSDSTKIEKIIEYITKELKGLMVKYLILYIKLINLV